MTTLAIDQERALYYSPLSFLRERREALVAHVAAALEDDSLGPLERIGDDPTLFVRRLTWDSNYFGGDFYRLEFANWSRRPDEQVRISRAIVQLLNDVSSRARRAYISAEVPVEDTTAIQELGRAGFRLIETRVTYFRNDVASFAEDATWPVRQADQNDIPHLRMVAAASRNAYDRYHADPFFGDEIADAYLATYVEASVRGLADLVLVPDDPRGSIAGAFFTAMLNFPPSCPLRVHHECDLQLAVGRIPLVAVSETRRGWHLRLLVEMTRLFSERGIEVAVMTTQVANRAVTRNCEKLGYRLGRVTHILAWS